MQNQEEQIKIIVTDDHQIFRDGVRKAFEKYADIDIIAEAENGLDLLNKLEYHKPDMIIMGVQMPVMNGVVTLPRLKQKYPEIKVIILTILDDPEMICKMIKLGASAYFTKTTEPEEIYKGILNLCGNWLYMTELVLNAFEKISSSAAIQNSIP